MASLTLANMLTRVGYIVPSANLSVESQCAILERMNYLVSLDVFPFQQKYQSTSVPAGNYRIATPSNMGKVESLNLWTADYERPLEYLDPRVFDSRFPNPSETDEGSPVCFTIKVAEGEFWFDKPTSETFTFRVQFYAIPSDVTNETVSQMVELAKLTVIKWAAADVLRLMQEHDRADRFENEGNLHLAALKRRYQLSREENARFMSLKEYHLLYQGH